MPKWIKHRVNKIKDLDDVRTDWGVEIDLRSDVSNAKSLHLAHDPWQKGDDFEKWLKKFVDKKIEGTLILNTKEDGLEERILELTKKYKVQKFFFLDTAFPTLLKMLKTPARARFSCRISSYEPTPPQEVLQLVDWLWVDCFGGRPLNPLEIKNVAPSAQLCVVSPELQGEPLEKNYAAFLPLVNSSEFVCTKDPIFWENALKLS